MKGETTMPDQGIVFDGSQKPREMRPGQKIKNTGFRLVWKGRLTEPLSLHFQGIQSMVPFG